MVAEVRGFESKRLRRVVFAVYGEAAAEAFEAAL
jgi:hypothetical protein